MAAAQHVRDVHTLVFAMLETVLPLTLQPVLVCHPPQADLWAPRGARVVRLDDAAAAAAPGESRELTTERERERVSANVCGGR
jgi:hypothetical protein